MTPPSLPPRPGRIDAVAALLVFGGLFGISQLLVGDFVVTGSLPAKGPILAVAAILYVASVVIGVLIRAGIGWLAAVNLSGLFALAYLPAFGRPTALALGLAHLLAFMVLLRTRGWFSAMAARRSGRKASPVR